MRYRFVSSIGLLFLAMPGCLFHGGYYPNGYYGPGPSVLPAQPWTGYPSGPTYQPSGPIYQPGVPMNQPGGTYPTPLNGNSPYTPSNPGTSPNGIGQPNYTPADPGTPSTYGNPPGGNNAPTFNPTPGNSGATGVPQPGDDDFGRQPGGAQRPTITPTSGVRSQEDTSTPFQQDSTRLQRNFDSEPTVEADSPFETPVRQASGNAGNDVRQANQQTEAMSATFKTYGNDPRFAWIQGTVEYDDPSNTWVILYNDNPRASDPYGGELTLADDPALARLHTGDVVRVYGAIDQSDRDARGKPTYRMTRAEPLKQATR